MNVALRMTIHRPADLDRAAVAAIARGAHPELSGDLLGELAVSRAATLRDLDGDEPVYGVNTGMGALSGVRLDPEAQKQHQNTLMAGRAAGSAPWLRPVEVRALLAVRLRTLLDPAAGVSPELCRRLAGMLAAGDVPHVPLRGGAAGEIIPLAHVGLALLEEGYSFGPKEGIAFLEGVPGLTGLSVLAAEAARTLVAQTIEVAGDEMALIGASRDPLHPATATGDPELAGVLEQLRARRGDGPARALQAPVSFRVTAQALAVTLRAAAALEAAVDRALAAVTDSPAHLDGRFVGTAGFAGTDLTASLGAVTATLVHLAEVGAARLHRLLDPQVTGLPRQLSDAPGRHAGMVSVHKRAVGVAHRLRRFAMPALIGPMETSTGQEDVQSFGFEAYECFGEAAAGLRDVLACEMLAVEQGRRLQARGGSVGQGGRLQAREGNVDQGGRLQAEKGGLDKGRRSQVREGSVDRRLQAGDGGTGDRPYGPEIDRLIARLEEDRPAG
ncbi:histidine ammonia-lyase [Paractinoplanes deccanensis]|uniref:Histidine ammonia-lyase n=1 Tax=Paractinoplanes deccanensis TaxID=113561 RepID=A0ABQ3YHF0_9ACTN|nr:aromatic amino acid lyase [Actinoplanes deccanensis]GID79399.1 histidine ammonia-lyase [Actinoplanes deccanensis]